MDHTLISFRLSALIRVAYLFTFLLIPVVQPSLVIGQGTTEDNDRPAIELNLQTLYHPLEKQKFYSEKPITHWLTDDSSKLVIRREDGWKNFDLENGEERDWPYPDTLVNQLVKLEGVDKDSAASAIHQSITQLTSLESTLLVRVDRGLALVSRDQPAKWVSKNITRWKDIHIDPSGSTVAYTKDHNLYVIDVRSGKHLRLTGDGSDTQLNGRLDWTYQEEIFGRGNFKGYWLDPQGQWLAMLKIDTTQVPEYSLGSSSDQRGLGLVSRYPKAGDPIPQASLLLWDLRKIATGRVPKPRLLTQSSEEKELLVTGVWWNPNDHSLIYSISDRIQSWREIHRIHPRVSSRDKSFHARVLREESEAWVEPPSTPKFLQDGSILWLSEVPTGFAQVYRIPESNLEQGKQSNRPVAITPDGVHVKDFWVHPNEEKLAFTADMKTRTVEQHLYLTNLDATATGSGKNAASNERSPVDFQIMSSDSGWTQPTISPDWKWALLDHSSATSPHHLSLSSMDSDRTFDLHSSQLFLSEKLHVPEFFSIPADNGIHLPAALIRPKTPPTEKLPVVVEVYGGPGSPIATNRWRGVRPLYRELLARRGIATFLIDNRSSAGRGMKDAWEIKGHVGEIELQDLRTGIRWLKEQDWVDADRLLIRGWSFGGFMTMTAMTRTTDFKAGIAGGSVSDWREYDAFYTERYMGLPSDNEAGYRKTSPLQYAGDLHGSIMLIHGEADDNVHPTGTLSMARALQKSGHTFDLMIYPDEAHAIRRVENVWHLSKTTDQFILKHLGPTVER